MTRLQRADGLIHDYLTIRQIAERWGVSRQRIHQWIEDGRVTGFEAFDRVVVLSSTLRPDPVGKNELNRAAYREARIKRRELATRQREKRRIERGRRLLTSDGGPIGIRAALRRGHGCEE
jgi:hypothetical protein